MKTLHLILAFLLLSQLSYSQTLHVEIMLERDYDDTTTAIIQLHLKSETGNIERGATLLPDSSFAFNNITAGTYTLSAFCEDYTMKYVTKIVLSENEDLDIRIYLEKICPYTNEAVDTVEYRNDVDYFFVLPTVMFKDLSNSTYDSYFNYRMDYGGYAEIFPWLHIGGHLTPYNFYTISKNDSIKSSQTNTVFSKQNVFIGTFDMSVNARLRTNFIENQPTNFYIDVGAGLSLPYYSRNKFSTQIEKSKVSEVTKLKSNAFTYATLELGISFVNIRAQYNFKSIIKSKTPSISEVPNYTLGVGINIGGWYFKQTSF